MATSGKKGKKAKAKTISLQNFLANGNSAQPGVTQVAKKVRSRDDSDDDDNALPQVFQLPTAPRANRIYEDDNSIPHKPPFLAYITNIPFDTKEDDIYEFFIGYNIESVRLPREDGEHGRLRGFGYIQFETREDLISAISFPDPQIKNRRIRINVSNENEQNQQNRRNQSNRSRYEGFGGGSSENKDSSNWRRGGAGGDDANGSRRSGYGYNRGGDRDRERERPPRDSSTGEAGSWRTGDRPNIDSTSPAGRGGGGGFGDRFSSGGGRRNDEFRSRRQDDDDEVTTQQERPKLKLQPRTLPLPEILTQPEKDSEAESETSAEQRQFSPEPYENLPAVPKPTGVSAEKVFGSAKPVDTAAREKEIEERMENARLEKLNKKEEDNKTEREGEEEDTNENCDDKKREEGDEEKSDEKHTEKDEKNNKNTTSWRKRDDDIKPNSFEQRKYSPDRRTNLTHRRIADDRDHRGGGGGGRDNRDRRDYNRAGYDRDNRQMDNRDRNERNDRDSYIRRGGGGRDRGDRTDRGYNKDNKGQIVRVERDTRDNRQRDEKPKPIDRPERPMPKYQPPQRGPTLSTSNKFAAFQEDEDASE